MRAVRLNERAATSLQVEAGVQEFIEAESAEPRPQVSQAPSLLAESKDVLAKSVRKGSSDKDLPTKELDLSDSDQLVTEITQLAGIPDPGRGTDQSE